MEKNARIMIEIILTADNYFPKGKNIHHEITLKNVKCKKTRAFSKYIRIEDTAPKNRLSCIFE